MFNVSHIDMILGIMFNGNDGDQKLQRARPKFHEFANLSANIFDAIKKKGLDQFEPVKCVLEQDGETGSQDEDVTDVEIPIGFCLGSTPVKCNNLNGLHLHKAAKSAHEQRQDKGGVVQSVSFPLLSQTLHTWLNVNHAGYVEGVEYHLLLITGAGKARNKQLDPLCDSTRLTAKCMELFVKKHYPHVTSSLMDSGLGLFHYDENVKFIREAVLPKIEELRKPVVTHYTGNWQDHLSITIALTDGSPARLAALNAALRQYKPNYMHMWQLKTYWHESRLLQTDLHFETFETVEARPAKSLNKLDPLTTGLVREMIQYKRQFEDCVMKDSHEIKGFWLRKTRKPVLSVLLVQKPNQDKPTYFRGMNVEVSMPTGSLCSERNVIGTALASDPSLQRTDLRMIAVLSMSVLFQPQTKLLNRGNSPSTGRPMYIRPRGLSQLSDSSGMTGQAGLNPISPCGACNEWLKKIAEVNPDFKVITFSDSSCESVFVTEVSSL